MKTLVYCSLLLLFFSTHRVELRAYTTDHLFSLNGDDCDDIDEEIVEVEAKIQEKTSAKGEELSPLEAAKKAYEDAKDKLDAINQEDKEAAEKAKAEGRIEEHGTEFAKKRKDAADAIEAARIAYGVLLADLLALYEQRAELLRRYKEECEDDFNDSGRAGALRDSERKIRKHGETLDDLVEEQVPDAEKDLGVSPEREPEESDEKYEERLHKEKHGNEETEGLPWVRPVRRMGESRRKFDRRVRTWERKQKDSKWKSGFWKRVADAIDKRFKDALDRFESDEDGDGLPNDEESSLPYDGNGDYIHYDFRFAGELESSDVGFHQAPSLPDLEHTIYSDPERFIGLMEALNAEHIMVDISNFDNFNPVFPQRTTYYGLTASMEAFPQVETSLRVQYGQRSATMDLPFTMFSFDGETQTVKGNWTANRQSFRLSGGAEYRLGNSGTQLLFGPRIGIDQISGDNEITVGPTGWTDQIETDRQLFYGLGLGLRQQLNGAAFSEVRASLERQAGTTNFLLGVRFGLGH